MMRPAIVYRSGLIEAAVWRQDGAGKTDRFSVSLRRRYRTAGGGWRDAQGLGGHGDCVVASELLRLAAEWIIRESCSQSTGVAPTPQPEQQDVVDDMPPF